MFSGGIKRDQWHKMGQIFPFNISKKSLILALLLK